MNKFDFIGPWEGLLDDKHISFNIRRSEDNYSRFSRKVLIYPSQAFSKAVFPGIKEKDEKALVAELKGYQNWEQVKNHALTIPPHLYSFLWRFGMNHQDSLIYIQKVGPVSDDISKSFIKALKKYQSSLAMNLAPGQIYLIPDTAVTFNKPGRFKQGYARRVLIIDVRTDQLLMIPFSTKIDRMIKQTDILFDSSNPNGSLSPEAIPAVENFPYTIFNHKVALRVSSVQPILRDRFIQIAIVPIGAVRRELLQVVRDKMKQL